MCEGDESRGLWNMSLDLGGLLQNLALDLGGCYEIVIQFREALRNLSLG